MVGSAEPLLLVAPSVAVVVPVLVPHRCVAVHDELLVARSAHVEQSGHHPVGLAVAVGVQAHAWVHRVDVELVVYAVVVVVWVAVVQYLRYWQDHVVDPDCVGVAAHASVLVVHPLEGVVSGADRGRVRSGGHAGPAHGQAAVHVEPQVVPEALCGCLVCERDVASEGVDGDLDGARLGVVDVARLSHVGAVDRVACRVAAAAHAAYEPVCVAVGGPSGWYRGSLEVAQERWVASYVWVAVSVVVGPS